MTRRVCGCGRVKRWVGVGERGAGQAQLSLCPTCNGMELSMFERRGEERIK